jgi:hypothetical protein
LRANAAAAWGHPINVMHHEQFSYFRIVSRWSLGCGPSWAPEDSDNDVYRSRGKTSKGPIVRFHVAACLNG